MDDDTIRQALLEVKRVLAPGGLLLVAEPMFSADRPLSTFMLKHDRGKFIRDEEGYKSLLQGWRIAKESHFDFSLHRMLALELVPEDRA
jgi:ubiquinone/menaquinone biosynthesis C-methylase UbiE